MILAWLAAAGLALASGPAPSDHTLVYYNARMALREGNPREAVKLWFLRNALESSTRTVSVHDADFRSVTWAALGDLGLCQDGLPPDDGGAGLWPLALHNWVVRNMNRRAPPRPPRPFGAFLVARQHRFVSIGDVPDARELATLQLSRGHCYRHRGILLTMGEHVTARLSDRQVAARLLRHLLEEARETLAPDRARGRAALEARLFDLDLQLTALAAREARQRARERAQRGRLLGLSRASVADMGAEDPVTTLAPDSEAARILRACPHWTAAEWMALSADRRRFLFHHARSQGGDPEALGQVGLEIVDRLVAAQEGEETDAWIALLSAGGGVPPRAFWAGDRGRRLLALDRASGFRERSVIALHRGVDDLERGDLPAALRSLAYAVRHAPDSRVGDGVAGLSRRWLSYVAGQFEITDDLLATLQEYLPRRDYSLILEDLMWGAAFRADAASFERGLGHLPGRAALDRRLAALHPLAQGNVARFAAGIRDGLEESPGEALAFLLQFVERLELEDGDVRAAHRATLAQVRVLLEPLVPSGGGQRGRNAEALLNRVQALVEGVGGLPAGATGRERARSASPVGEVYAGSLRLAPADPLPWPFMPAEVTAPSVFAPLRLTPVEWRDAAGELVFGWSVEG